MSEDDLIEEIEGKWKELRDIEFTAERRAKAAEDRVKEAKRQIADLERELHDEKKKRGTSGKSLYSSDIQKGAFRIERHDIPHGGTITTLRAESDEWINGDTREYLSLEIKKFMGAKCRSEIKKEIGKMIKDLQWLLENMPCEWG